MTSIGAVHGWIEYAPTSATTRAEGADRPLRVHGHLGLDRLVPRLCARQEVLAPVAHPLRGPSRESCEGADGNLLGVERALHTEAAPHVGSDDAKPVRRQVEQLGKRLPQEA